VSPRRRALLSVVLAAIFTASLLAAAAAAPPPEDVCGVCGDRAERAVEAAGGPDVAVAESRLDVHVRENSTALARARNELRDPANADWVANNTDAVARALSTTDDGIGESRRGLSVHVDDETVVVEYVDETFAYRTFGGVLVVDALTRTPTGWEVNAAEFAVWAPGTYQTATHDRGHDIASWTDSAPTDHVVFAPDNGPVSAVSSRAALVAATAPAFLRGAAVSLAPLVGALAVLFRAVDAAADLLAPAVDARAAGGVAVAAGVVAALALAATGSVSLYLLFPAAAVLFTAATAVAAGAAALAGVRTTLWLTLAAVGVPLSAAAVAGLAGAFAHPAVAGWTIARALAAGSLAAQLGAFVVFGATRNADGASSLQRFAAVLAPAVAVVAVLGPSLLVVLWVPVVLAVAPLAYLLGASVAPGLRSV